MLLRDAASRSGSRFNIVELCDSRWRLFRANLNDLTNDPLGDLDDGNVCSKLQYHRAKTFVESQEAFGRDSRLIAVESALIARQNRHNLNARVKRIDNCARSLQLKPMHDRFEWKEDNFRCDQRDYVRIELNVVVDAREVLGPGAFLLLACMQVTANETGRDPFDDQTKQVFGHAVRDVGHAKLPDGNHATFGGRPGEKSS